MYKKAGLSAIQCLSVSLCGDFLVLAPSSCDSFVLASNSSQPPAKIKISSLQELFWIKFQRTAQALRLQGSQASEPCSPSTCNFTSSLKKLHQRAHHLALIQQQLSVLPGSTLFSLSPP
ncbi:hypothetical protein CRENBAI_026888, partial [Crenichthys baileyi]